MGINKTDEGEMRRSYQIIKIFLLTLIIIYGLTFIPKIINTNEPIIWVTSGILYLFIFIFYVNAIVRIIKNKLG